VQAAKLITRSYQKQIPSQRNTIRTRLL